MVVRLPAILGAALLVSGMAGAAFAQSAAFSMSGNGMSQSAMAAAGTRANNTMGNSMANSIADSMGNSMSHDTMGPDSMRPKTTGPDSVSDNSMAPGLMSNAR